MSGTPGKRPTHQLAALDYGVFVYKTNQNADKVQSRKLGKEDSAAKAKIALAGDQ